MKVKKPIPVYRLIDWLIDDCLLDWMMDGGLIDRLIDWLIDWLIVLNNWLHVRFRFIGSFDLSTAEYRLDQAEQKGTFKSAQSLKKVPIPIAHTGFLRAGDQLFAIEHLFAESEMDEKPATETLLFLAWLKAWQSAMKRSLLILLRRGAEWKKCRWPQPLLFSAVRGLDSDLVQCLVELGVNVNERLTRNVSQMRWFVKEFSVFFDFQFVLLFLK